MPPAVAADRLPLSRCYRPRRQRALSWELRTAVSSRGCGKISIGSSRRAMASAAAGSSFLHAASGTGVLDSSRPARGCILTGARSLPGRMSERTACSRPASAPIRLAPELSVQPPAMGRGCQCRDHEKILVRAQRSDSYCCGRHRRGGRAKTGAVADENRAERGGAAGDRQSALPP